MKFFADTANLSEIEYCFSRGVCDGITTNPKIIESTGDLSNGFESACKKILDAYPHVPVSLETDLKKMDLRKIDQDFLQVKNILVEQALQLSEWGQNVVVKIPICRGGLLATEELSRRNISTNVTACMTPFQAIRAAECGSEYVSLFANRMLDSNIIYLSNGRNLGIINSESDWKGYLNENKKFLDEAWKLTLDQISFVSKKLENSNSSLIVGSIRSPKDIFLLTNCGPQIITIPTKIVQGLENISELKGTKRTIFSNNLLYGNSIDHPMTYITLEEFEKSASSYRK